MTNQEFKELREQTITGIADIIERSVETGDTARTHAERAAPQVYEALAIDYADERGRFIRLRPDVETETPTEDYPETDATTEAR